MKFTRTAVMASLLLCALGAAQLAQAGQDTIRRALAQIVPEPYNVNIDPRISPDTVLQWDDTSDWMAALKQAAARGNLKVQPRWDAGRIDVAPGPAPVIVAAAPVQPAPAAQVVAAPIAIPAVATPAAPAPAPAPAAAPASTPVVAAVASPVKEAAPIEISPADSQSKPAVVKVSAVEQTKRTATTSDAASVAAPEPKVEPDKAAPKGKTWTVQIKDLNLANTFQRWADAAGWRVRWDAAKHVMVEAPDSFTGSFEDAITAQLSSPGIAFSSYPLEVCFYPNTPPLARITRKGDQAKECQ